MSASTDNELHIDPPWRPILARAGMDTLDKLLQLRRGAFVARHKRRQTRHVELDDATHLFLKRDHATKPGHIFADWRQGRRSQPLVIKERAMIQRTASLGIRTPEVIAWGQRRRFGLPWQAAMLTIQLPGLSLGKWLEANADPARRLEVLAEVGGTLAKLNAGGLFWPDALPKHVLVDDAGRIGLLDLERMEPVARADRRVIARQMRRLCLLLHHAGATGEELLRLLNATGPPDGLDIAAVIAACSEHRQAPVPTVPAEGLPAVRHLTEIDDGRMVANSIFLDRLIRNRLDSAEAVLGASADELAGLGWRVLRLNRRRTLDRMVRTILRLLEAKIPTCGLVAYGVHEPFALVTALPASPPAGDGAAAPEIQSAVETVAEALTACGLVLKDPHSSWFTVDPAGSEDGRPVVYVSDPLAVRKASRWDRFRSR